MCEECVRYAKLGIAGQMRGQLHKISAETRRLVFIRDHGHCHYCGVELSHGGGQVDHILPVTRGGTDVLDNLALACPWCNSSKHTGDKPKLEERNHTADNLWWEKEIVWLRDPTTMPYVRARAQYGGKVKKPKYPLLVAYAVLRPDTPPINHGYGNVYVRRCWIIQEHDFYRQGWPSEGVATSSVIAGQEAAPGRDF